MEEVGREQPLVCVLAVPPLGYMHVRYLCRRLRSEFPDVKIVAAILTERDVDEVKKRQPGITADELASSLKQAMAAILSLVPTRNQHTEAPILTRAG